MGSDSDTHSSEDAERRHTEFRRRRLLWLSDANTAHTERWVKALSACGHQLLVFSLASPVSDSLASIKGVRFESANISRNISYSRDGSIRKLVYLSSLRTIKSLAKSFRPDVIHAHYASSYGVLAAIAGLRPWVLSIWGADVYQTPYVSPVHKWVVRQAIRSADKVLSTSEVMRQQGYRLFSREISVVPFGIDMERFSWAEMRLDPQRIVVGTIKSLEDKYGIDVLLRAFAAARRLLRDTDIQLLIVGDGSERSALENLARELGIADDVQFVGRIPYEQVHEFHKRLDVAVFPSVEDSESFGVSVVEAQATGRPVIVSRVGGLPEVVREGETGLIVEPRNSEELAMAIVKLVTDEGLRRRFGRAGREHVQAKYDLDRCLDLLERHYDSLS